MSVFLETETGTVVRTEAREKVAGKSSIVSLLTFKGDGGKMAAGLRKMHGLEKAKKMLAGSEFSDSYWTNVKRILDTYKN